MPTTMAETGLPPETAASRQSDFSRIPNRRSPAIMSHSRPVALFEIEADHHVTILAVRQQREDDYH